MSTEAFASLTLITDSNGNEIVQFTPTASAVNFLEIANAATTNAVIVAPAGSDTNIGVNIKSKGTGNVQVNGYNLALGGSISTAGAVTFSGAFAVTLTASAISNSTLPAGTHTLAAIDLAQTYSALQTFGNNLSFGGVQVNISSLTSGQVLSYNGTNWVNSASTATVTADANTTEQELTTTTATTIATFTPTVAGNFKIGAYFRVVTAATTVTLSVTYTDATGAQTITLLNAISEAVGSYTFNDFTINSAASAAITVSMTAGTANQVFASATIIGVS